MAGDSARREHERIRSARLARIREQRTLLLAIAGVAVIGGGVVGHTMLGAWWIGPLIAMLGVGRLVAPSQREIAWRKGAEGEEAVGRALDRLEPTARAMHDRLIPGSRANIDHILVAPTGVWTIDAKNYTGKLETRGRGRELWIKGRNRSKLLDQAQHQAEVVRQALAAAGLGWVPVSPALCFLGVEWPLVFRPRMAGGVRLLSRRRLPSLAQGSTVLTDGQLEHITEILDVRLRAVAAPACRKDHPPSRAAPTPPTVANDARPTSSGTPTVRTWKRYGQHRLYVNLADGTTLGYIDLETNDVAPTHERHREMITAAVARHLRGE